MSRYTQQRYYRLAIVTTPLAKKAFISTLNIQSDENKLTQIRYLAEEIGQHRLLFHFYDADKVATGEEMIELSLVNATLFALSMTESEVPSSVDACADACLIPEKIGIKIFPLERDKTKKVECFESIPQENIIPVDMNDRVTFFNDLIMKLDNFMADRVNQDRAYALLSSGSSSFFTATLNASTSTSTTPSASFNDLFMASAPPPQSPTYPS